MVWASDATSTVRKLAQNSTPLTHRTLDLFDVAVADPRSCRFVAALKPAALAA